MGARPEQMRRWPGRDPHGKKARSGKCHRAGRAPAALPPATHDIDEAVYLGDRVWVLDSHPGRLAADIAVDLPRPRARDSQALAERRSAVLRALQAVHAI